MKWIGEVRWRERLQKSIFQLMAAELGSNFICSVKKSFLFTDQFMLGERVV